MSDFNFKQYLKEGRLFKEDLNYPQVDIEIQGKIYTIPVNLEDRERIFEDAEFELDGLLEDLGFNLDGVSSAALASDLTQKDFIDSYGNEDTKTFERVKSLGVQVDAIRGLLDGKINSTIQNNQLKENTNENIIGKAKDFFKFRSSSQLGKAVTQILDRLENLPEVIDAKKEGMKLYKLQKLIRSKATPEEYKLLQYVVDKGDFYSNIQTYPLEDPKSHVVKKVYDSEIGLRMAKMGFFVQTMTDRYTGNYPLNSTPDDFR